MAITNRYSVLYTIHTIFFMSLTGWWITIYARGLIDSPENSGYTLTYPFLALLGSIIGIVASQKWGGFGSRFGKTVSFLTLGFLFQFLGQAIYAYYIYVLKVDVPYPSFGDIGYFGSVLFYIIGLMYLTQTVGIKMTLQNAFGKIVVVLLPIILLAGSYLLFLQKYDFTQSSYIKIFLDFGYPLGQAFYLSLTIIIILAARNIMGGTMRTPLLLLLVALLAQYLADFMFLYQAQWGTWYIGGPNDFLYSVSYFLMATALTAISSKYNYIKNSTLETTV